MNKSAETLVTQDAATAAVVGQPHVHESAVLHVTGEAMYTDDIPELQGTLHAAFGLSTQAHARIAKIDLAPVQAMPGVVAVLTAADIPGANNVGTIIADEPLLAGDLVQYYGQPVFIVIANSHTEARAAARKARIVYEPLPAVLDARTAHAHGSYVLAPMRLRRGEVETRLAESAHVMSGQLEVGGQEQFYLEGQIASAIPKEQGGMHVLCSTQHPSEMQHLIANALHVPAHQVQVECRRMGGGFGGKETQSALWACGAALAAAHLKRPVKLRADRDDDMMVTGKRHPFSHDYTVGYDDTGRITALRLEMILTAGFSADLSGPVATRAICHADNAYYLSDVDLAAFCAKTNTQSNTAFRGFGGPQGAFIIEYLMDSIARRLGLDPLDVRRANFYERPGANGGRDTTPYGQKVSDNVIHELVEELETRAEYRTRRSEIDAFNATSPVLKKGLALTPVKFGISFNLPWLNQAGALVHVYTDGSVLVNHGGTEMGQGLHTKVAQVVAHELGIPLSQVRATATDTTRVANTSATAASTGADLNGKAAQDAARRIRERLASFVAEAHGANPAEVRFAAGQVHVGGKALPFAEVVLGAYQKRVQLWSDGFYSTPGLHWDRETMTGNPFYYFAYGAAVSEVIVDTLTGEWRLLRADALYDAGQSLNPALDVGQVTGGFIQGMGWLTMEELCWNGDGRLTTHAPSTYKIPSVSDCPAHLDVRLFRNRNAVDSIHRSKAVGEPPLLLPFSVFFAIRDAIDAAANGPGASSGRQPPPLQAPATSEAILNALEALRAGSVKETVRSQDDA